MEVGVGWLFWVVYGFGSAVEWIELNGSWSGVAVLGCLWFWVRCGVD